MLAGRDQQLGTFFDAIGQPHPRLIAVRGLTGRGKSEFLREIAARVQHPKSFSPNRTSRLEYKDTFAALYEIQGEFEDWAFPFLDVLRQILTALGECGERKQTMRWIGSAMAKAFQQSAGKIAGAIVKDVLEKGFKETTAVAAEILTESLKKVSIEKSLEELLGQHRESVMAAFLSLLNELAASAPPELRFLLIFDNVQMGTDQFCSALKFLGRKAPERFYVVYAFNDEVAEGQKFEQQHWASLKSLGQTEIEIPPMKATELRRWIDTEKSSSHTMTQGFLEQVCVATDGRPFYIDMWMKSGDFAQKKVSRFGHLDGYFKTAFGQLSDHATQVAQIAAMLPGPLPDGCADFAAIFGAKAEDADGWVRQLAEARIFGESRERPWFRHSLVQSYVQGNELSAPVKRSLAERAVEALAPRMEDRAPDYLPVLGTLLAETGDAEKSIQINLQLARRLIAGGEYSSALVSLERAQKGASALKQSGAMVEILLRKADILATWGDVERADTYHKEAAGAATPGTWEQAAVLHHQGIFAHHRGNYDGALDLYLNSLKIKEQLGNLAGVSASYHQIGIVKQHRGDYEGALELYQKSLKIKEQLGNLAGVSTSYHQMGMVKQHRGDYDGALELYQKSLKIKEQLGNLAGVSTSIHQMGRVKQDLGDYDGALELYRKSLKIKEQLGDLAGLSTSYHQIGRMKYLRGDYDGALNLYQKSLKIKNQLGDLAGMSTSHAGLGLALKMLGREEEACKAFRRAAELYRQMKLPVPEVVAENLKSCP